MNRILIQNGNVITYNGIVRKSILLEEGIIAHDDYRGEIPENCRVISADGMYVSPGFVEIHAHGGGGFDYMDASAEAFEAVAEMHLSHGTTSIMPTAVACSRKSMSRLFDIYRRVKDSSAISCLGLHLEGPYVSREMCGAQNPRYVRNPEAYEIDSLMDEAGDIIAMCTAAPELPGIEYMAERMLAKGIVLSAGHSDGVFADIRRGYDMGFHHITHLYSNTPTVRKINQVVYAGVREAAYLIDGMAIELIGDGHHVAREVLQLAVKFKGADQINLTTDAMRAAGTDALESYLGEINPENRVIIEDGVAKLPDRSYYAGSIATGDTMLKWAVEECGIAIEDAIKMLSTTPARIAGADSRKGSIAKGKDADILIIEKNLDIQNIIAKGVEYK